MYVVVFITSKGCSSVPTTQTKPQLRGKSHMITWFVSDVERLRLTPVFSPAATLMGTMADVLPCRRRRKAPKPEVKEDVRYVCRVTEVCLPVTMVTAAAPVSMSCTLNME